MTARAEASASAAHALGLNEPVEAVESRVMSVRSIARSHKNDVTKMSEPDFVPSGLMAMMGSTLNIGSTGIHTSQHG